jgi:phage shock protein A
MGQLFQKFRTLALGTAHDLLDKAIDMNSPTMLRQYVRDLEKAELDLKSEAAVAAGALRTLTREKGDIEHRIADETTAAKNAQAAGNTVGARAHGLAVVTLQKDLAAKQQELADQTTTSQSLDAAVTKIDAKHTEMVSAVRRLESLDRTTKAKEKGATALASAASLTSSGSGISIDNIEAKMRQRGDVADEKFDRAMNDPAFAENATQSADVDAFLATLK